MAPNKKNKAPIPFLKPSSSSILPNIFKVKRRKSHKENISEMKLNECRASFWSENEVSLWLDSVGLSIYKQNFTENAITGYELLFLSKTDFLELGVTPQHQRYLLKHIDILKAKEEDQRVRQLIILENYQCRKAFSNVV